MTPSQIAESELRKELGLGNRVLDLHSANIFIALISERVKYKELRVKLDGVEAAFARRDALDECGTIIEKALKAADACATMDREINQLKLKVKELLKEREWISVKERLPEEGMQVLIYEGNSHENYRDIRRRIATYKVRENGINWYEGGQWNNGIYTTHWMPLPQPPKEKTE